MKIITTDSSYVPQLNIASVDKVFEPVLINEQIDIQLNIIIAQPDIELIIDVCTV
jgi:hypothetical protein